ncbi:murein L,D-transpeptidase catalytic domain-containing protein [Allosphingosinicella vermicomposti]|uniref:murein L,D-transpeptidase catalytic domain-containing protein n=1 Tax=Allosphingosinicella vermicomposti TaxID=614671 RepID=UPI001FE1C3D6|nr:murein L,D-transpeptidase catalytic domain family protein [Allosphingosinicella vermicomposti]
MIQSGVAAGAAACVSAPAIANQVWASTAPPQPRINPLLLARAREALQTRPVAYRDMMGVVDFAMASRDPRFFLVDVPSGVATEYHVAHGRGSDPGHSGWLEHFSNVPGSEASSAGAYLTANVYYGKYGRSLRLQGLDHTNSNAEARAIVVHSARYAEPEVVATSGKLGRSEGCFALSALSLQYVLFRLGPGRMIYADKVA